MKTVAGIAAHVRGAAKANGLTTLNGSLAQSGHPFEVSVPEHSENPVDVFLAVAVLAKAQLILIQEDTLTARDVEGAEGGYAQSLKQHVGETHTVQLLALPAGLTPIVSLTASADWAAVLLADDPDDDADAPERNALSSDDMTLARALATDPRFPDANFNIRLALLKRLAPATADPHSIVAAAEDIWELDLRPVRDTELREKAWTLLEQGAPKNKVAAQLGLKNTYALNKLLGEA